MVGWWGQGRLGSRCGGGLGLVGYRGNRVKGWYRYRCGGGQGVVVFKGGGGQVVVAMMS